MITNVTIHSALTPEGTRYCHVRSVIESIWRYLCDHPFKGDPIGLDIDVEMDGDLHDESFTVIPKTMLTGRRYYLITSAYVPPTA